MKNNEEKIIEQIASLKGRRTTMEIVKVKRGDKEYHREIVHRPEAAVAVVRTQNGKYILIEQFRTAIQKTVLEAPAGCLEKNEDPCECIKREVEEETGHKVTLCHKLMSFNASVGYSDEVLHIYFVEVLDAIHGQNLDDEERISVKYFTDWEIYAMIDDGEIVDGKTILSFLYFLNKSTSKNFKSCEKTVADIFSNIVHNEKWTIKQKPWGVGHYFSVAVCPCGKEHSTNGPFGFDGDIHIVCQCGRCYTIGCNTKSLIK